MIYLNMQRTLLRNIFFLNWFNTYNICLKLNVCSRLICFHENVAIVMSQIMERPLSYNINNKACKKKCTEDHFRNSKIAVLQFKMLQNIFFLCSCSNYLFQYVYITLKNLYIIMIKFEKENNKYQERIGKYGKGLSLKIFKFYNRVIKKYSWKNTVFYNKLC